MTEDEERDYENRMLIANGEEPNPDPKKKEEARKIAENFMDEKMGAKKAMVKKDMEIINIGDTDLDETDVVIANDIVTDESKSMEEIADGVNLSYDELQERLLYKKSLKQFIKAKIAQYKEFQEVVKYRLDRVCDGYLEKIILKDMPSMKAKDRIRALKTYKEMTKPAQGSGKTGPQTNIFINENVENNPFLLEKLNAIEIG